ncbi:hypothetical protein Tco_1555873, partial [Tanacetum coccineum]
MGDANPIRTLGDYSKPSHEDYRNTIELPVGNNVVPLHSDTIRLVQNGCSFHGLRSEDPNQHLKDFLKLVDSLDLNGENRERTRLRESLSEAWTRFKDLLQKVPHHGIDLWLQVQIFYDHVNPVTGRTIDQSAGGKFRERNAEESWALLEDLALYENESWNDPKDFAKPVKAISLPQDVLEELVSNFMASQDARLSKFEADLKQQQSEMTNKINTVLKAITDRLTGALPSDTEEEQEREGVPEDTNTIAYIEERRDTPLLERKDITAVNNLGSNKNDDGIEWLDVEEPLDLVDTSEESVYESLIKKMPKCSLNYDFKIKKGDPRNLKIPCMIGHKFTTNAYIDVDLPMNIMALAYYNSIRKNGYEYKGRNFVGLGKDMHVFVGNISYVIDFTILENVKINIDPSFEDDYDRGCRKPSDLEEGFYRDTIKLGPEYVTRMDDEGEVTLVPSCFVIFDLEPLSLSFDFVFSSEIFKSFP